MSVMTHVMLLVTRGNVTITQVMEKEEGVRSARRRKSLESELQVSNPMLPRLWFRFLIQLHANKQKTFYQYVVWKSSG